MKDGSYMEREGRRKAVPLMYISQERIFLSGHIIGAMVNKYRIGELQQAQKRQHWETSRLQSVMWMYFKTV